MSKFGVQAITLHGTQYSGVRGYQYAPTRKIESEGEDGTVYETMHNVIQASPVADLTTRALKSMVAPLTGSSDLPYLALNGTTGLKMFGAKASITAPGYASGTVHHQRLALNGCIYMAGLRWSLGDYATMGLRALFRSTDGITDPVTDSDVAIPAAVIPVERFVLSALTIGGSALDNVQSVEIAVDPKLGHDFSTGLPYPIAISGAGHNGHLSAVMTVDAGELEVGEGTGACSAVFTQVAQGSTLGTATFTATLNAAWGIEEDFNGQQGQPIGRRLVVRTRYSGSTRPFAWGTT